MTGSGVALRVRLLAVVAVLLATLLSPAGVERATAKTAPPNPDGPSPSPAAASASASGQLHASDLASVDTGRWIVQLDEQPAAAHVRAARTVPAARPSGRFHAAAADSQAYESHLAGSQRAFEATLAHAARGATVDRRYSVALNGMAVRMSRDQAAAVRRLPGVKAVTPDVPFKLDMYSTPAQIGAPTLWNSLGGQANAGAGVKVAVIDSGIYVTQDASGRYAGNPCFDDAGYQLPGDGPYPLGDTRFTNKKVIVARTYFRPDDPPLPGDDTAIPGPQGSPHGTHTSGTVACNANTHADLQGTPVTISGVAPHAWLMNYRVFYQSHSTEDFQTGNAYVAELVQAIDDAVRDGADVISNSWGSSYQNTLAWPDPMVQAAESAVDAGVVMVFANGNAGQDTATTESPANSPKVIGVGAITKDTTISSGVVDVTGPAPVPVTLTARDIGPAQFGPPAPGPASVGPATYVPAEKVATNASANGCSLASGANPFPPGSFNGAAALIVRGSCEFADKVANAEHAGAIGVIVYNSAGGGDNLQSMGTGARAAEVTIPSWFMRRTDGLAMVAFATAHPGATARYTRRGHPAANAGDVLASFTSFGPTQDKTLKPDVVAPGVDVLSSGYAAAPFPGNLTGFGSASGTSMATPHVAGSAALLRQLHPDWEPGQIKSALMSTATENVWLDTAKTQLAPVLGRGAGRIDLTRAGNPGLTFDQASVSAGELVAGKQAEAALVAQNVSGRRDTWDVAAVPASANLVIKLGLASFTVKRGGEDSVSIPVEVSSIPTAPAGDLQGDVVLTSRSTGTKLHVPVWLRVVPTTRVADVLLVDDDGSRFGAGADYGPFYRHLFDALGISYRYLDVGTSPFPSFNELFGYKAVVMFTGDNASFDSSGLALSDQDALSEWLDSGGRLWAIGQNLAEATDSNSTFNSPHLGRARIYHGYLGVRYDTGSLYAGAAPRPTGNGQGPLAGLTLDLSPGADGAGNQSSIEGSSPLGDTDTFNAVDTMVPLATPIGGQSPGSGMAFGRSSEPSLEESRQQFRYRSVEMGFGLEGLNATTGHAAPATVASRTLQWLLDSVDVTLRQPAPSPASRRDTRLSATAVSSSAAAVRAFRWDFGDGSPAQTTSAPSVDHRFRSHDPVVVRVEATDSLGHRALAAQTVPPTRGDN
jgi:subtilisin family serine protease